MMSRDTLQQAYELAFFPPAADRLWNGIRKDPHAASAEVRELVGLALLLHLALPERGYASQRALKRLANYQADARPFCTVTFLHNLRRVMGETEAMSATSVPGWMVRDVPLPVFGRSAAATCDM